MADHAHEHHQASSALTRMVETANHCAQTGEICIAHCMVLLGEGHAEMADCNKSAHNMAAVCRSLASVASFGSAPAADIKALATACAQFCRTCAAACKKHASEHEVCKACMDSCNDCADACEAYVKTA